MFGAVWPLVLIIIVFLALSTTLLTMFFIDILTAIVNIPVLWFIIIRSYFEVTRKRIIKPYFIGLIATTFIFIFLGDYLIIPYLMWQVEFVLMIFIISELITYIKFLNKEYNLSEKLWLDKPISRYQFYKKKTKELLKFIFYR